MESDSCVHHNDSLDSDSDSFADDHSMISKSSDDTSVQSVLPPLLLCVGKTFKWLTLDREEYEAQGIITSLCERYVEYMWYGKGAIKSSPQEMAQIELLHMLKETNSTPLHLFDDIT